MREDKPFFLPLESELDALVANTRQKMYSFLQLLKETGIEPGEAWKLRWVDVDIQRKTVAITPTKNHNARVIAKESAEVNEILHAFNRNEHP